MARIVGKVFETAEAEAPAVVETVETEKKNKKKKEEGKVPGFLKKK